MRNLNISNKIFKNGKHWELISGPWLDSEKVMMENHIYQFEKDGIGCMVQKHNQEIWVYRDAKGWLTNLSREVKYIPKFDKSNPSKLKNLKRLCNFPSSTRND